MITEELGRKTTRISPGCDKLSSVNSGWITIFSQQNRLPLKCSHTAPVNPVLLWLWLAVIGVAQGQTLTNFSDELTFGSQTILDSLWSPEERQGRPDDRKVHRLPAPDRTPPARTFPITVSPPLPAPFQRSIRRVNPVGNNKPIALTFDLCERADDVTGYDAAIVNALRQEQVRATFFAGGRWMRSHPEQTLQLMVDPLFEIGNHGWSHGNLGVLTDGRLAEQILWTQAQYELLWEGLRDRVAALNIDPREMDKISRAPATFRPPYGRCHPEALNVLASQGIAAIQWSIVSGDAVKGQNPERIIKTVLSQAAPGAIVIFHANGRSYGTAAALPAIIKALKAKGYEFVTVSELLRSGEVIATEDCYELKPGDNRRYDRLFGEGTGE